MVQNGCILKSSAAERKSGGKVLSGIPSVPSTKSLLVGACSKVFTRKVYWTDFGGMEMGGIEWALVFTFKALVVDSDLDLTGNGSVWSMRVSCIPC